jgi:hypothetical protein
LAYDGGVGNRGGHPPAISSEGSEIPSDLLGPLISCFYALLWNRGKAKSRGMGFNSSPSKPHHKKELLIPVLFLLPKIEKRKKKRSCKKSARAFRW